MTSQISKTNLDSIILRSQFISELLDLTNSTIRGNVDDPQVDDPQVKEQLNIWCQTIAHGNWDILEKRLNWDNVTLSEFKERLQSISTLSHQHIPAWTSTLQTIVGIISQRSLDALTVSLNNIDPRNPHDAIPFEDALLPFLLAGRQQLFAQLGITYLQRNDLLLGFLTTPAYLNLERGLLKRLSSVCASPLQTEFSEFRPVGHNLLLLLLGEDEIKNPKRIFYYEFIDSLLAENLIPLFIKYPVLARLAATIVDLWVATTLEFLHRLQSDLIDLNLHFTTPRTSFSTQISVIDVQPMLSDVHHWGRTVVIITLDSGTRIVYKPKDLGSEHNYNSLLNWFNNHGNPLPFKILSVLKRQDYGWVEFVEHIPCQTEADIQNFYRRAGMLLCLLYVLETTDCHDENIIACGEYPILIDVETLMHHKANPINNFAETSANTLAYELFWDSVLRTGMLPHWEISEDGKTAYDISALGSVGIQQTPNRRPQWKNINTDLMSLTYEAGEIISQTNIPFLNEQPLTPDAYINTLVTGFREMYRFLIETKDQLLAVDGLLHTFQDEKVRYIFRSTHIYYLILNKSLIPEHLQNGIAYSTVLDLVSRAFLMSREKPIIWPILRAEIKALERMDIPYFAAQANSESLTDGVESTVEHYFKTASYQQVIERFHNLSEIDLSQQIAIIQGTFHARIARPSNATPLKSISTINASNMDAEFGDPTTDYFITEAKTIASDIERHSLKGKDDSLHWIGLSFYPNAMRFQFQPLTESLYDGRCGIALFFAALYSISGDNTFRELALGTLISIRKVLQAPQSDTTKKFAEMIGIGGAIGIGSIIYALVRSADFLRDTSLLDDAIQAATLITEEVIFKDRELDVIGGAAGAILSIILLYQKTNNPTIREKAILLGQHLLSKQISVGNHAKAWRTFTEQPLTGFSHGTAGIVYALIRLYHITANEQYLQAAHAGIAYENSVFSPEASNWPDLRVINGDLSGPKFMLSWCNGSVGIGLSRLGCIDTLNSDSLRADVEAAIKSVAIYNPNEVDHICCGHFGTVDLLLVASEKLHSPNLLATAKQVAARTIKKAQSDGFYRLFTNLPAVYSPGLFQGTAGIGYEILRLAFPSKIPSVLLWQ